MRALERWRHLIGRTSGPLLVELVVDALNVIFEGSDYRAEQREERFAEDFWIIGPGGDVALVEAKGQSGGISRTNVGQVDSHREQVQVAHDFPGLLVVNAFRNTDDPRGARKTSRRM